MKEIKKLSILALGMAFAVGLASCGGGQGETTSNPVITSAPEPTVIVDGDVTYVDFAELEAGIGEVTTMSQPTNYPGVYVNEQNKLKYELSDITVHLAHTRTKFYLGEEFSSNGIIVLASFISLNEDGSYVKDESGRTKVTVASVHTFFVDSSAVDTSIMGTYDVSVSYRYGETVKVSTYTISVSSSEFETTENLEYYAGVKANYKQGVLPSTNKLSTDGRILTRLVSESGSNDFELDLDTLELSTVKNKVNGVGSAYEQMVSEIDLSTFTNDTSAKKAYNSDNSIVIDYSSVNAGKEGNYMITVTYNAPDLSINGVARKNVVQGFIMVNINNPITAIAFAGQDSDLEFESTIEGINLNHWKIRVTKEVGDPVIVDYDDTMFKLSNVDDFKWNQAQTITVSLREKESISFNQSIFIAESESQSIVKYIDLSKASTAEADGSFKLGGTDFIFGPAGATYTNNRTDGYGSMTFPTRLTIKGAGQMIRIDMDKPGQILAFYATTGDEERELVCLDSDKNEIATKYSSGKKQEIVKCVFNCESAGTYYIYNPSGGMYFHGVIIAKAK